MRDLLDRHALILFVAFNIVAIAGTSFVHGKYGVPLPNPLWIVALSGIAALAIRSFAKSLRI
ncbi:MAG: hypothetical protein EAY70_08885 [Sphingomonadales bacterium]|nr:MAG: hypothetical protein EAY70_08885 [Sphingomonadales bacterium]